MRIIGLLQILSCLALGFVVSWALIGLYLRRAAKSFGSPRERDFHHGHIGPIPRLGGLAMATSFVVICVMIACCFPTAPENIQPFIVIVLGSLAMFGLGFVDDIRALGAKVKLAGQIAIASAAYAGDVRIELFKNPFTNNDVALGIFGYFATVLWLVGLTNLINLIDGIDGLAGGICLMLMLLLANLGGANHLDFCMFMSIGVAGAILGFLKHNYPPAKIYMGDGGAYFLGFLIGVLSIANSDKGTVAAALIAPAFALALPIVDVSLAVLRRGLRGLPIFRPDQKHIHHQMLTLGVSRERTLLNLYTVCLLCLFLALCLLALQGRLLPLYTGLLVLILLFAGHLSGFTKSWSGIKSQFGHLLRLRRETNFALALDRALILSAGRHHSIAELWSDYQILLRKLGFCEVMLIVPGAFSHAWRQDDPTQVPGECWHIVHEMSDGTSLKFSASKSVMPEEVFTLLGDLAAETWYKGERFCRERSHRVMAETSSLGEGGFVNLKAH